MQVLQHVNVEERHCCLGHSTFPLLETKTVKGIDNVIERKTKPVCVSVYIYIFLSYIGPAISQIPNHCAYMQPRFTSEGQEYMDLFPLWPDKIGTGSSPAVTRTHGPVVATTEALLHLSLQTRKGVSGPWWLCSACPVSRSESLDHVISLQTAFCISPVLSPVLYI